MRSIDSIYEVKTSTLEKCLVVKWAPLKLIAIVVLPHDALLVMGGDHAANGLKCKFATEPLVG